MFSYIPNILTSNVTLVCQELCFKYFIIYKLIIQYKYLKYIEDVSLYMHGRLVIQCLDGDKHFKTSPLTFGKLATCNCKAEKNACDCDLAD